MKTPEIEFIGNKAIIKASGRLCETPEELVKSGIFKEVLDRYIDALSLRHSMLLNIFGEEEKTFLTRMAEFFKKFKEEKTDRAIVSEKRNISQEQRVMLGSVLVLLCKIKAAEVTGVIKGSETLVGNLELFIQFLNGLYEYWRRFDRFLMLSNDDEAVKPRTLIKENSETLTVLVRNTYRDIKENLSARQTRIFRQVRAGSEITAIVQKHPLFPLQGIYAKFAGVPVVRQIIIAPPLILNPPMNKRKGSFVKAKTNPAEAVEVINQDWICYPAKAGSVLIYVYVHKSFVDLGLSLCNLFELADDDELSRKPDAIYFYGVQGSQLDGLADSATVFYEDNEAGILTAGIPGRDEYGYFGYLKKMILTLHNIVMMKNRKMPFHGAFVRVILKGGKSANILMMGDSGAGKSETIEAFSAIGDEYIQDLIVIADDMGSIELQKNGVIKAYGTEIGAFLRIDDLSPGYAFGKLDAAVIMSVAESNARLILPVAAYDTIMKGYDVDYVLYVNNYEETGKSIERFSSADEALAVFREGKVMSKGTTTSTGIINSYFANIFGPPQYMELHETIAADVFRELFKKGTYVGQLRTRLGVEGFERKGPEESARALLDTILSA